MTDIVRYTAATVLCPKSVTVTLKGQTGMFNSWATDAILLESPEITKYSDGYQITLAIGMITGDTTVNGKYVGGCIHTVEGSVICIRTDVVVANGIVGSLSAYWIPSIQYRKMNETLRGATLPWKLRMRNPGTEVTGYNTSAQKFLQIHPITKRDWGITYSPDC
jgi:hypothetical protein